MTAVFAGRMTSRTEECIYQMDQFKQCGGTLLTEWQDNDYSIVIDALFGVGLNREITGHYLEMLQHMNMSSGRKLAVDIPSGISATDGRVFGEAFQADATVTFQERKLGLFLFFRCIVYPEKVCETDIGIDQFYSKGTAGSLHMH